jgi:hypothetical protein
MTEQSSNFSEFDSKAAGEALGAESRALRDVAYGDGQALSVGNTVLEVYPTDGFARVTTQHARIELFRVPTYGIDPDAGRVVFEQGENDDRSRLLVRNDGKVSFYPVLRGPGGPTTTETAGGGAQDTSSPPTPSEGTTASPTTPESGETEPVQLMGRLGRNPWFNTHGDTPTAGFPLAVNDQDGKTTWHRVIVSGEVAQQVQEGAKSGQFKKGRLVNLTGHEVVRTEPTERGGTRTTREIHATVVSRMTTSRTKPAP